MRLSERARARYAVTATGPGVGVLPRYVGDDDPRLVRLGAPLDALAIDLWLLTHPDLRRVARVRTFNDFVADALLGLAGRLNPP